MSKNNLEHQKIFEICLKSQEIMEKREKEIGPREALAEADPYSSMWEAYHKQIKKPVELKHANLSGFLFKYAKLYNHNFIDCDFSGSRWINSFIKDGDCTGSNFSEIRTLVWPFVNTNCTHCDFTNAVIRYLDTSSWEQLNFAQNNFESANFTNAKLNISHSFFKDKKHPSRAMFKDAVMNGCRLTITREKDAQHYMTNKEIKSILNNIFSPEQLAVMHIDYGTSGCFIATATCGIDSEEVIILRHFRDTILVNSVLGRQFVKIYYRISPSLASFIEGSPKACYVIRNVIVHPIAKLVDRKNQ